MNPTPSFIDRWMSRIPASKTPFVGAILSLIAGLAVAVMFHYLLYRIGLPSKPFIYVAF